MSRVEAYDGRQGCPECGSRDGHYMMCSKNPLQQELEREHEQIKTLSQQEKGEKP